MKEKKSFMNVELKRKFLNTFSRYCISHTTCQTEALSQEALHTLVKRRKGRERSERKIGNLPVVQDLGPAGLSFNI